MVLEELLSTDAAAKLLCLKPATIRRWTFSRKISFVRVGTRSVRFRRADLEKFISAGERPALRPIAAPRG